MKGNTCLLLCWSLMLLQSKCFQSCGLQIKSISDHGKHNVYSSNIILVLIKIKFSVFVTYKAKYRKAVEFSTFSILFWFISVPAGICFGFLSRTFSTICMVFNILVFQVFAYAAVFSFIFDANKNTSLINLHRVALLQPTATIQCIFSYYVHCVLL